MPAEVCVNRGDLNPSMAKQMERRPQVGRAAVAGPVRYDKHVASAQIHAWAAVEIEFDTAHDIRDLWKSLRDIGERHGIRL